MCFITPNPHRGRVRDVSGGHSNVCNRPERNPSSKINTTASTHIPETLKVS